MVLPFYTVDTESGRHELSLLPLTTQPECPIFPGAAANPAAIGYREEALNRTTTATLPGTPLMVHSREAAGHEACEQEVGIRILSLQRPISCADLSKLFSCSGSHLLNEDK